MTSESPFERAYFHWAPRLKRMAITNNVPDSIADELIQDAMLVYFRKLNSEAAISDHESYVFGTMGNMIKSYHVSNSASMERFIQYLDAQAPVLEKKASQSVTDMVAAIFHEEIEDVLDRLQVLMKDEKQPVRLGFRYLKMNILDDKTIDAIAAELSTPEGTIRTRINAAKHRLRHLLTDNNLLAVEALH